MQRGWSLGVVLAVLLGGLARLACLGAEFWLDEIWSFELAHRAGSPWGILFGTRHDNNHHLNTLWLSLWPAGAWWGWYRLHSVLAGMASVVLAARLGLRAGRLEAVLAGWLVAGCSWLVLAGAEARGYGLAVCFALLALDALWSYLDTGSRPALVLFWLAVVLGFGSHLTFVHAFIGLVVWSLRRFARQRRSAGDEVRRLLVVHGVPGAFLAAFYLTSIRGMDVGGGPSLGIGEVLTRLVGLGLGGPEGGWAVLPFALAACLLLAGGLWLLWRRGNDVWVFFAVAIVGSPGLFLVRRPPILFERYFLIPLVFFLVLSAFALGALVRDGGARRAVALALLGVFLVGNARTVGDFIRVGRGQFHEALAWVLEHDPGNVVRVTGGPDWRDNLRTRRYVRFYAPYPAGERQVVCPEWKERPAGDADWLLVHRIDLERSPAEVDWGPGQVYRLVKEYPSSGLGAWGWFVYRRVGKGQVGQEQGRRHPDEGQELCLGQHQPQSEAVDGDVSRQAGQALPRRRAGGQP